MQFKATLQSPTGEVYEEAREAPDTFTLYRELRREKVTVLRVDALRPHGILGIKQFAAFFRRGVSAHERIIFVRNLGAMIGAGLPLARALSVLGGQTKNKTLQQIITRIGEEIRRGKNLSQAVASFPRFSSPLFVAMVRSGEESGTLVETLKLLATQLERGYAMGKHVLGALIYPAIVFTVMVAVAVLMLSLVVPSLTAAFHEVQAELPLSTKIVIAISDTLRMRGLLLLSFSIALLAALFLLLKSERGRRFLDRALLLFPVLKSFVLEINVARTTRTLATLIIAGIDVVTALHITEEVVQNRLYREVLSSGAAAIEKGRPLSGVFRESEKLYPTFVTEMIAVGEETGKLSEMLLNTAVFYEESLEQKTKNFSTVIEPILMVVVGAAVGFFAIAMITPAYSLLSNF